MRSVPISARRFMGIVLLVVAPLVARAAVADEPYFPDLVFDRDRGANDFTVDWYSKHLAAMKEPSLWALSRKDPAATTYRFLWLPTFHHPAAVRLVESDGGGMLHAVLLDGKGGYEPGKVIASIRRKLNDAEWKEVRRLLDRARPWDLPTTSDPLLDGEDGDQLIVETVRAGKYHIVDRWGSTETADYRNLCRHLLALSGLDVMKTWKEYREE
ncbi:hypothetical protein [Aquisphaera insulae]|uniref:hypothetical protein n=1 Tax=Aquisphaera insulae TaxID=2712864 RepID=UPI0013EE3918|nr:hypothetical protein [Aquisphaera insulae]